MKHSCGFYLLYLYIIGAVLVDGPQGCILTQSCGGAFNRSESLLGWGLYWCDWREQRPATIGASRLRGMSGLSLSN